jgi:hypothetical protein
MAHRKNILDLEFQKNLQYLNTSIILLFTYLTGVILALMTGQISTMTQALLVITISAVLATIILMIMIHFRENLKSIPKKIARL